MPKMTIEDRYREAARQKHKDGELEIDDTPQVAMGDDRGAYVQAWVWVPEDDLAPDDDGEDDNEYFEAKAPDGADIVGSLMIIPGTAVGRVVLVKCPDGTQEIRMEPDGQTDLHWEDERHSLATDNQGNERRQYVCSNGMFWREDQLIAGEPCEGVEDDN